MNNQLTAAAHVRDGGGTIDSSEVTEMLRGLFSMAGVSRVQGGGGYKLAKFRIILTDTKTEDANRCLNILNIYTYIGMHFQVEVDEEAVLDCAESIMEALDIDGDGEITKVEAGGFSDVHLKHL